jgi:hypothetical protein
MVSELCYFNCCDAFPEHNYCINLEIPAQEYDPEIIHSNGCCNHFADTMARTSS